VTATEQGVRQIQQMGGVSYLDVLVFPLLTFVIAALLGVGLYTRRNQAETLARLGLARPTPRDLAIAAGVTIALIGMAALTERAWQALDPDGLRRVGGLSKALMGNFTGLAGALAVGFAAAIGEETFFRGAYQPRMGILLTSLLFTSFHVQYGITPATLLVLAMSVILGLLRRHTSLTVCLLVHFFYNFSVVLLAT
ncbi:MAG: CPBP family intramembrane metalloprotease, partial [Thermoflexales bacterium]|nr:CPBP family intramembrane metalloprotease [Thermoflexales bacterium]